MRQADLAAYYGALVQQYGDHPMGGHWSNRNESENQYKAWRTAINVGGVGTVLDFGCGTGIGGSTEHFMGLQGDWVVGCDICREALTYTPYPAFLGDHTALRPASVDWVLCMGCFNIGYPRWFDIVKIWSALWHVCRVGMAISFARERTAKGDPDITAHDLDKWLRAAEYRTQKYVLRADWSVYSSLLVLWKERL